MSKFNKCTVAVAVAMALGLPVTAMAATAGYATSTTSIDYARNVVGAAGNTIASPDQFNINTQATDNIIGRTTGFGVRFTLGNGATFNAAPDLVRGAALPAGGASNWSVSTGTLSTAADVAVYSVQPGTDTPGIDVGNILNVATGGIVLRDVGALATVGATIPMTVELFDSNTSTTLITLNATLARSVEGVVVTFNTSEGDVNKRIDVARCTNVSPIISGKRRFSIDGSIGGSCNPPSAGTDTRLTFNAGSINVAVQGRSSTVAGLADNNSAGSFILDVLPAGGTTTQDRMTVTVTGTNFAAFDAASGNDRVFIASDAACTTALAAVANTQRVNAAQNSATITIEAGTWGTNTGGKNYLCFQTGTTLPELVKQSLTATVFVDNRNTGTLDSPTASQAMLPMLFNGTVLEFQNVNPGANATAQSFLRFTNMGAIDCPVTLTGTDDAGVAGASPITFTLATKKSMQINADVLENGGTGLTGKFGDGAGKWYVVADAECGSFIGSALNRNNTDGTVTNLTPDKR